MHLDQAVSPLGPFGWIDVVRVTNTGSSIVASYHGLASSIDVLRSSRAPHRLLVGTYDGMATVLALNGSSLTVVSNHRVSTASVVGRGGDTWIVSGQRAARVRANGRAVWQSTDNGYTAPAGLALDMVHEDGPRLWVSSVWRIDGFDDVDNIDDERPD
jgi:hypothetical protein